MPLTLRSGEEALNKVGFPVSHGPPILGVAKAVETVILSRAVGPVCQMLIEERYDTKSFRIHGKSCDWGPMAGFVCRDPRLNKKGLLNARYNTKEHIKALYPENRKEIDANFIAKTAPIHISDRRLQWLIDGGERYLGASPDFGPNMISGKVTGGDVTLHYVLIRDRVDGMWWGLHIDNEKYPGTDFWQQMPVPNLMRAEERVLQIRGGEYFRYEKLLGMVNPDGDPGSKKSTVTGDYDLFGIWPHRDAFHGRDEQGRDMNRRLAPTQANADIFAAEDADAIGYAKGNYNPRVLEIGKKINQAIGHKVVHHSDEAGNPGTDDVDLPLIAFIPRDKAYYIETIDELDKFILYCIKLGYIPEYNKAWFAQIFARRHGYLPGKFVDDLMRSAPKPKPKPRRKEGGMWTGSVDDMM